MGGGGAKGIRVPHLLVCQVMSVSRSREIEMTNSGESSSDLDPLKVNVTCPKCREPFKEPKLLPCLHCACVGCLSTEKGVRTHEGLKYIVACPVCREERELPKTGLSSLPDAHFKSTMVKLYKLLKGRGGRCEECKMTETSAINSICDQCGFVCDSCVENHKKLRAYSHHKTIPLKDGGRAVDMSDKLEFLQPASGTCNMTCVLHAGEPLKMYCKTCKRLVCRDCTVSQHRQPNHQIDLVSSLISTQKEEVRQHLSSVQELQVKVSGIVKEAQSSKETLEKQRKIAKSTITTSFEELVRKLEELKMKLLHSVDQEADCEVEKVNKTLEQAEKRVSEIENLIDITDQCFKYCTDQEFMMLKYYMLTRLKEEVKKKDTKFISTQASFDLPFSCLRKMSSIYRSHLELCHSFSAEKSSLSHQGALKAEAEKLSSFLLHTRTKNGSICLEKVPVEVSIVMPRTGETLDAVVTHGLKIGTYEVSYVPTSKGQYKISVKAEGQEVNGSPFFVTVKASKLECTTPVLVCERQEWPWGVACSSKREIYVTRNFHHMVTVLDKDGHTVRSFGVRGHKAGQFLHPTGIAVDSEDSVYVADGQESGRVQKFNRLGQFEAVYTKLSHPQGVMVSRHGNQIYVCDRAHSCVVVLDNQLRRIKTFGELSHHSSTDGYEDISGHLTAPHSIAEDNDGLLYVTDSLDGIGCIHVFTAEGEHLRTITHSHTDLFMPLGICIEDEYIYVCDGVENCLVVFRTSGEFVTTFGSYGKHRGQFHSPLSVTIDLDGFLYVCDHNNARVQVF